MLIALTPWEEGFIPFVAKYANNARIAANLRDVFPWPYADADAAEFVRDCMAKDGQGVLSRAILAGGECVGSISVTQGADVYRRSGELGYWLAEPYWGQGIMTWAVREVCREAFEKLDIVRIYAESYAHNMGSRRVLEKAGFVQEGTLRQSVYKNGQMYDACIYALLKEESGRAGGDCP